MPQMLYKNLVRDVSGIVDPRHPVQPSETIGGSTAVIHLGSSSVVPLSSVRIHFFLSKRLCAGKLKYL